MGEEEKSTGGEDGKMGEGVYSHPTPFFSSKPSHPAPLSNSPRLLFFLGNEEKAGRKGGGGVVTHLYPLSPSSLPFPPPLLPSIPPMHCQGAVRKPFRFSFDFYLFQYGGSYSPILRTIRTVFKKPPFLKTGHGGVLI